jgi:hypothetical protein
VERQEKSKQVNSVKEGRDKAQSLGPLVDFRGSHRGGRYQACATSSGRTAASTGRQEHAAQAWRQGQPVMEP